MYLGFCLLFSEF
nr:unnamed protein product [Callosobruchus analis]